jgi:hypothetical protein
MIETERLLIWVGGSKRDLMALPGVLEIVEDDAGGTYRAGIGVTRWQSA